MTYAAFLDDAAHLHTRRGDEKSREIFEVESELWCTPTQDTKSHKTNANTAFRATHLLSKTETDSASFIVEMRNFGATAPPLAPEPASDKADTSKESTGNTTTGSSHGAAKKEASDWPGGESSSTNVPGANMSLEFGKSTPGSFQTGGFGDNSPQSVDVTSGTKRLAKELDEFVAKGSAGVSFPIDQGGSGPSSDDAIADLQLQTARKLRQLLPTNRELLNLVQERAWVPVLLGWLNLHDRPAVQVEALLALTNIAELCAHHSYYQHAQAQSSATLAAAAAAQAAAAASKSGGTNLSASTSSSIPPFYSYPPPPTIGDGNSSTSSSATTTYPYPSLLTPPQGQVPFPPLSFSQKMTPEALAALDATLTNTIQQTQPGTGTSTPKKAGSSIKSGSPKSSQLKSASNSTSRSPFASLSSSFPPSSLSPGTNSSQLSSLLSSASSLSAAASSSSSSPFLPPPTPVPSFGGGSSFPQQLSASSQNLLLRHADAIPTLISLLSSPNREVYEQAMWILGSIAAGDSPGSSSHSGGSSSSSSGDGGREKSVAARDVILAAGIMNQMLRCLEAHPENLSLQRIGSWTLSNLVEGLFQQSSHKSGSRNNDYSSCDEIDTATLLPVLRRLLHMADAEVLSYTCWTLSHLCDGPSSHISAVVTTRDGKGQKGGLVPRLVELLVHPSWRVTKPALRTIGNIVCAECSEDNNHGSSSSNGPTDYTEVILDCSAVPRLKELVTHSNREIQKEACWTLSNIAAGTVDQIQSVIDSGAIPPLVKLVGNKNTDQEVRSEACWVVLNATSCGSDSQIEVLVEEGCVSVLGVLLGEASMVMMALEGLERVLQVEETREAARREQVENGEIGEDEEVNPSLVSASLIEKALDKHNSSAVNKRANRIWKQHFVSCALCNQSFSKHRTADATFCDECKCYVCSSCDCKMYHLSYQEELWAVDEEETEAKKSAKKSKKQKKKEKQKQKKAKQQVQPQATPPPNDSRPAASKQDNPNKSQSPTVSSTDTKSAGDSIPTTSQQAASSPANGAFLESSKNTTSKTLENVKSTKADNREKKKTKEKVSLPPTSSGSEAKKSSVKKVAKVSHSDADEPDKEGDPASRAEKSDRKPPVDFVLYLQETGSIIALAKLMDALDYGDGSDYELDDADAQLMSRHQQMLNQQATT